VNYHDSPEEAAFRAELRRWLAANVPGDEPPEEDEEARSSFLNAWHRTLYGGGWLGLTWPVEAGGRGLGPMYEGIFNEELGAANAPSPPGNIGFLGKAIIGFGSAEQQKRYLPTLLKGEERWCQGFSEPSAGSDLAALRTRADLDGDRYVVNGQKVWTSFAKWADWCLLLARTDKDVPKHKGISAFIISMHQPGIEQRPLKMISGVTKEFGQVLFDGARVPVDNMVGAPGDGWKLAMTIVSHEREPSTLGFSARYGKLVRQLASRLDGPPPEELSWAWVQTEMLRLHVRRRLSEQLDGITHGPQGSLDKLLMTWVEQSVGHAALATVGTTDSELFGAYMYSRAQSVMGGTSQIQKNIIASRILGLGA
jgi:alkylation response protein AidB-like acyl-CoA dehydrogenase